MRAFTVLVASHLLAVVAVAQAPAPKPEGNVAQVMRGILFPHANLIFDTQTEDPGIKKKPVTGDSPTAKFGDLYSGWQGVENSALALAEAANLLLVPGRLCENGRPAPLKRPDWVKYVQELRNAARAAYRAAQSKNQDNMIEVSGTVTESCDNCHQVYRDKARLTDRCQP